MLNKFKKYLFLAIGVCFFIFYFNFASENKLVILKKLLVKDLYIEQFGSERASSFVTIVSVYFRTLKSKHENEQYDKWIENMLNSVQQPLVILTDEQNPAHIVSLISKNNLNVTIVKIANIWNVLRALENFRKQKYLDNYMYYQNKIDPQANEHSSELYAIRNIKTYFMYIVSLYNPYESSFFIYTDMDAFREGEYPNWPSVPFVRKLNTLLRDRILYGQINFIPSHRNLVITDEYIQGTFFAGSKKALQLLVKNYFDVHDEFFKSGKFVGNEEIIMNYLTFYATKDFIVRLKTIQCSSEKNKRYFYQYYFANTYPFVCDEDRYSILKEK